MRKARNADTPRRGRGVIRRGLGISLRLAIVATMAWGVLVGVREGYAYATTSPRFEVRGLLYEPTPHVDDARLRELLSLSRGTNILSLDLDALAAAVVAEPWVARASVVRVLPDSLQVTVEEHEPAAVLLVAGRLLLIDAEGLPFKTMEAGERERLPVLTGFDDATLLQRPQQLQEQVTVALGALSAYRAKQRPRLSEINVGPTGELTLYTAELGTQLRMGRGEVEPALARYDALRAALGEEAEKLALVHLDASRSEGRPDRVAASFFPAKQAPSLVVEAEAAAAERAERAKAQAALAADKKNNKSKNTGGKSKGKLPRYH